MKSIALDFGLKRTGIAITDERNSIAFGLTTIDSNQLIAYLQDLFQKEQVDTIIVGEPKRLNLAETHITSNVQILIETIQNEFPTKNIKLVDERFTSKLAAQTLHLSGFKKKKPNKHLIDEISATIILQSYLKSLEK